MTFATRPPAGISPTPQPAPAGEAPRRAIQRINEAVNRAIRFTPDVDQYGASDHWASAAETLRSGRGDCEDYAILKYWALAAIGVPAEAMRLVLVRDVRRRLDHAVLMLAVDGENLVLDSLSNEVKTDAAFRQYEPRLSLAADGSWLHGRFRPQIARADIPSGLLRVADRPNVRARLDYGRIAARRTAAPVRPKLQRDNDLVAVVFAGK